MRRLPLLLTLALGCTSTPLPGMRDLGADADPDNDGAVPADLGGATCADVKAAVQQWLDTHRSCKADAECGNLATACGLPAQCGDVYSISATGAYFMSLIDSWRARQCDPNMCLCPDGPTPVPGCN